MPNRNITSTIKQRLFWNEQKQCVQCRAFRHSFSRYCAVCKHRFYKYGAPDGRAIQKREYDYELGMIQALLSQNSNNQAVLKAIEFCEKWLNAAVDGIRVPDREVLALHAANGVKGKDILMEALAVYLFAIRNPRAIPGGWRGIYSITGLRIIRLRKLPMRTYGTVYNTVGKFITENLQPVFERVLEAIKDSEERIQNFKKALDQELEPLNPDLVEG